MPQNKLKYIHRAYSGMCAVSSWTFILLSDQVLFYNSVAVGNEWLGIQNDKICICRVFRPNCHRFVCPHFVVLSSTFSTCRCSWIERMNRSSWVDRCLRVLRRKYRVQAQLVTLDTRKCDVLKLGFCVSMFQWYLTFLKETLEKWDCWPKSLPDVLDCNNVRRFKPPLLMTKDTRCEKVCREQIVCTCVGIACSDEYQF